MLRKTIDLPTSRAQDFSQGQEIFNVPSTGTGTGKRRTLGKSRKTTATESLWFVRAHLNII